MARSKDDPNNQFDKGVNREDNSNRRTPAQDRKPVRDDQKPDTPATPTRKGGLSGGYWKK